MTDTSLPTAQYSSGTNTGIAFNYGPYLERIADALEIMAENSTTIATKITEIAADQNTIATKITEIAADHDTVATNTTTLASVVKTINSNNCTDNGPHIRTMSGECPPGYGDIDMRRLSRAMMMYNMRTSGTIDEIRNEFNNPSAFP